MAKKAKPKTKPETYTKTTRRRTQTWKVTSKVESKYEDMVFLGDTQQMTLNGVVIPPDSFPVAVPIIEHSLGVLSRNAKNETVIDQIGKRCRLMAAVSELGGKPRSVSFDAILGVMELVKEAKTKGQINDMADYAFVAGMLAVDGIKDFKKFLKELQAAQKAADESEKKRQRPLANLEIPRAKKKAKAEQDRREAVAEFRKRLANGQKIGKIILVMLTAKTDKGQMRWKESTLWEYWKEAKNTLTPIR